VFAMKLCIQMLESVHMSMSFL